MRKSGWMVATLLLVWSAQAEAMSPAPPIDQMSSDQVIAWTKLLSFVPPPPPPAKEKPQTSRDDSVQPIAPGVLDGVQVVWSDRPVFVWSGSIGRIDLCDEASGELLWSQPVSPEDQGVAYTGEPLQPGGIYEWMLCDRLGVANDLVTFQVMSAEERDRIAAELAELEAGLRAEGATTDAIALQRARYFADRQLWTDVLREALAI